jgi:hypothetical protein
MTEKDKTIIVLSFLLVLSVFLVVVTSGIRNEPDPIKIYDIEIEECPDDIVFGSFVWAST